MSAEIASPPLFSDLSTHPKHPLDGKAGGVTAAVGRGMNVAEARLVLNVEENATKEQILEVAKSPPIMLPLFLPSIFWQHFEKYHMQNGVTKTNAGSPFLQAKILNAKNSLLDLDKAQNAEAEKAEENVDAAKGPEDKK